MIEDFVLDIQSWFSNWTSGVAAAIPLGFAFGAGMLSAVNPCGFVMLPAYMSLYLGTGQAHYLRMSRWHRTLNALVVGGVVSLAFVLLFGIIGLGISAGGRFLIDWFSWMGLVVGVALVGLGVLLLLGKHVYMAAPTRLAQCIGGTESGGVRSYFLFGLAYAICSLSCTLPVFLVVVGSAAAAGSIMLGTYQFVSYSLGMALVLVVITVAMALFKGGLIARFRGIFPYMERISAVFLVLVGTFVIYYWVVLGDVLG